MKKLILTLFVIISAASAHSNAASCSLDCKIIQETILTQESPPRDIVAFRNYCQSLGGNTIVGSTTYCTRWDRFSQIKYGSGVNTYEAELAAKRACGAHICGLASSRCPSGIRMASIEILSPATCDPSAKANKGGYIGIPNGGNTACSRAGQACTYQNNYCCATGLKCISAGAGSNYGICRK